MTRISGPRGKAREVYDAVVAELNRAGASIGALEHGGRHYRLPIVVAGRRSVLTLPASPSDKNAIAIKLSDVRRTLRAAGVAPGRGVAG